MKNEKLIPKRRFKEFINEATWEQRGLSEIATFSKGRGYSKKDLRKVGTPIILYGRMYTKYQNVISEVDTYAMDREGSIYSLGSEVIVPSSGESAEDIARASVVEIPGVLLGGDLNIIYPNKNIDPAFLSLSISYGEQQSKLVKKAQGKSVVHLHNVDLQEVTLTYPTKDEQMIISKFFRDLDNLITLHQRKVEKTKAIKAAYLALMFPAEGECKPRYRFKGFSDNWEQRELRDLTTLITKGTTPLNKSNDGNINFIKIENIDQISGEINLTSKITEEEHNSYLKRSKLQENDILFSIAGTLGRIATISREVLPANTNQALAIIRISDIALNYVSTFLKGKAVENFVKKSPTVGAQPNLSLQQIGDIKISFPKKDEQIKVGAFFEDLDNLIDLHQRKLEKLENIKKAYLNEMLI